MSLYLSQDWLRLYGTVKSPWSKQNTSSCPSSDSTPHLDSVPWPVSYFFNANNRTVTQPTLTHYTHVLWFLLLQVTLCTQTRGSWTSTCLSLCTTFITESLMSAPLRRFAGQCLESVGVDVLFVLGLSALMYFVMMPCSVSVLGLVRWCYVIMSGKSIWILSTFVSPVVEALHKHYGHNRFFSRLLSKTNGHFANLITALIKILSGALEFKT